jgi:hypothetical protein
MGYHDVQRQLDDVLQDLQTDYVDLLLIHWPESSGQGWSSDLYCQKGSDTYDPTLCRLNTWRVSMPYLSLHISRLFSPTLNMNRVCWKYCQAVEPMLLVSIIHILALLQRSPI